MLRSRGRHGVGTNRRAVSPWKCTSRGRVSADLTAHSRPCIHGATSISSPSTTLLLGADLAHVAAPGSTASWAPAAEARLPRKARHTDATDGALLSKFAGLIIVGVGAGLCCPAFANLEVLSTVGDDNVQAEVGAGLAAGESEVRGSCGVASWFHVNACIWCGASRRAWIGEGLGSNRARSSYVLSTPPRSQRRCVGRSRPESRRGVPTAQVGVPGRQPGLRRSVWHWLGCSVLTRLRVVRPTAPAASAGNAGSCRRAEGARTNDGR